VSGLEGPIELCLSEYVIRETRRNVRKKAPASLLVLEMMLDADAFNLADPAAATVQNIAMGFELKDAPIIAGAVAGQCAYLATYDRAHLLSQSDRILQLHGIVVAPPDKILATLL
jgi:predicted nucleic acid-binding protein